MVEIIRLVMSAAIVAATVPQATAGSPFSGSTEALPCNDACKWWMSLGKPEPQATPQSLAPERRATVKAIAPPQVDFSPAPTKLDGLSGTADAEKRHERPALPKAAPQVTVLPPERPAELASASLWNVPIAGSASILPATFVAAGR